MSPSSMQQQVESQLLASYESLYRLAYTYVKNPDDAMDVVQESAFKAISRSADVRSPAAIRGWLCRIVVNTATDVLRARSRQADAEHIPETGQEDVYQDTDLMQALDLLDERERTVIVLRFFQELKLQEIAQVTGERSANKEIEQLILKHIADFEKRNGAISFDDGFAPRSRS